MKNSVYNFAAKYWWVPVCFWLLTLAVRVHGQPAPPAGPAPGYMLDSLDKSLIPSLFPELAAVVITSPVVTNIILLIWSTPQTNASLGANDGYYPTAGGTSWFQQLASTTDGMAWSNVGPVFLATSQPVYAKFTNQDAFTAFKIRMWRDSNDGFWAWPTTTYNTDAPADRVCVLDSVYDNMTVNLRPK